MAKSVVLDVDRRIGRHAGRSTGRTARGRTGTGSPARSPRSRRPRAAPRRSRPTPRSRGCRWRGCRRWRRRSPGAGPVRHDRVDGHRVTQCARVRRHAGVGGGGCCECDDGRRHDPECRFPARLHGFSLRLCTRPDEQRMVRRLHGASDPTTLRTRDSSGQEAAARTLVEHIAADQPYGSRPVGLAGGARRHHHHTPTPSPSATATNSATAASAISGRHGSPRIQFTLTSQQAATNTTVPPAKATTGCRPRLDCHGRGSQNGHRLLLVTRIDSRSNATTVSCSPELRIRAGTAVRRSGAAPQEISGFAAVMLTSWDTVPRMADPASTGSTREGRVP